MKPKFKARELILMTLPVLILGGAALWRSSHLDKSLTSELFDESKPLHVAYSPLEPLDISPLEASRGYSWKARSNIKLVGIPQVPANWKQSAVGIGMGDNIRVVYRRGKTWQVARPLSGGRSYLAFSENLSENHCDVMVDLSTVPRNAEEVRLRGMFERQQFFSGPLPTGWKPPTNMRISGPNRILYLKSKPFDVPIKETNQIFPAPAISREVPFQIVDARWIVDYGQNYFVLQARRLDGGKWDVGTLNLQDVRIQDEKGRPLNIGTNSPGYLNQHLFSPEALQSDLFVLFVPIDVAQYPIAARGPLNLRAKVSDGKSWPLDINVSVPRTVMKLRDFGAPTPNR